MTTTPKSTATAAEAAATNKKAETPLQNGVGSTVDKVEKLRKENHFFVGWQSQQQLTEIEEEKYVSRDRPKSSMCRRCDVCIGIGITLTKLCHIKCCILCLGELCELHHFDNNMYVDRRKITSYRLGNTLTG